MGYDLRVIISPAKKMRGAAGSGGACGVSGGRVLRDGDACDGFAPTGIPPFPERSVRVLAALRSKSREELRAIWKVSERLLDESCRRTEALELPMSWAQACEPNVAARLVPAIFSYEGIQFQSLAPEVLDEGALGWLQAHLWVLSALHGCVRPFDAVMPYRLEMGARLAVDGTRDLYEFWGPTLAARIAREGSVGEHEEDCEGAVPSSSGMQVAGETSDMPSAMSGVSDASGVQVAGEAGGARGVDATPAPACVINLASVEYAKAVVPYLPPEVPVVTCIFGEELKGGRPVQRSTASKVARGSMVRWLAEHQSDDPADLRTFDVGYHYEEALSERVSANERAGAGVPGLPTTLVFMRAGA